MTKQDLIEILEKNYKKQKTIGKVVLVIGIVCVIAGVCLLFSGNGEATKAGYVCGGIGAFFVLMWILQTATRSAEKQLEYVKDAVNNNPRELVWAYIFETRQYGRVVDQQVVLKFRNKKELNLMKSAIPGKNPEAFLVLLRDINPQITLGYSEELVKKYKRGELG